MRHISYFPIATWNTMRIYTIYYMSYQLIYPYLPCSVLYSDLYMSINVYTFYCTDSVIYNQYNMNSMLQVKRVYIDVYKCI